MTSVAAVTRKTVTVLFCDLTGSTALGERLDPEALRLLLHRWHAAMGAAVERHGGTVEKFIGDAVMAVFGVPHVHEDDALRAVRAALEMRAALARLNDELRAEDRPGLQMRIGINSGEVVTGNGATTLVTGDAVNTAKRLEEAAVAGEILIGDTTRRLVENAAKLEQVPAVAAKGKRAPVDAWRVLGSIAGAVPIARRLDAPLVGREHELALLRAELARAERERTCRLVTVLGAAGIGKSRLARELLDTAGTAAAVLSARCLPYGDGITFLPVAHLVRSAGGEEAVVRAVQHEPDGRLIADRLCGAIGTAEAPTSSEETFWAIRRVLETLSHARPLLVCVEDVHWAEPTFLDLLEYVAGWSRDAPIMLLCLARPELLDTRPRWGGAVVSLEPLTDAESERLLDELAAEWPLPPDARARIADAADGNPLYVEQLVAMVAERGHDGTEIPPTLHALLAARLDRLEPLERAMLERAAVAGKEFWRGAVVELSPEEERPLAGTTLLSLVRKELVRPETSAFAGDDGFRFRHALIRDAAYAEIPKELRAALHERFARWLAEHAGEDELVGYHLEQAVAYRADLGVRDDALAIEAAALLASAGRRAFAREDMPAAASLLERALALDGPGARRPALLRELGAARWRKGEIDGAHDATREAIRAAAALGDVREEWLARLDSAAREVVQDGDRRGDDLTAVATEAVRIFGELRDDAGLSRAWRRLAMVSLADWRFADAASQAEHALEHARRAGDSGDDAGLADAFCSALLWGAEPAGAAARRCRELLAGLEPAPTVRAAVASTLACLEAMQESFTEARVLAAEAAAIYEQLGLRLPRAGLAELVAIVERLAGDFPAAERELRHAFEVFDGAGSRRLAGIQAANLASVAVEQGRLDAAEEWLGRARERVTASDRDSAVPLRLAEARVAAARGRSGEALAHADAAVAALDGTEWLSLHAEALGVRAAILGEEPVEALALYERKGNLAAAARLRSLVSGRAPR